MEHLVKTWGKVGYFPWGSLHFLWCGYILIKGLSIMPKKRPGKWQSWRRNIDTLHISGLKKTWLEIAIWAKTKKENIFGQDLQMLPIFPIPMACFELMSLSCEMRKSANQVWIPLALIGWDFPSSVPCISWQGVATVRCLLDLFFVAMRSRDTLILAWFAENWWFPCFSPLLALCEDRRTSTREPFFGEKDETTINPDRQDGMAWGSFDGKKTPVPGLLLEP